MTTLEVRLPSLVVLVCFVVLLFGQISAQARASPAPIIAAKANNADSPKALGLKQSCEDLRSIINGGNEAIKKFGYGWIGKLYEFGVCVDEDLDRAAGLYDLAVGDTCKWELVRARVQTKLNPDHKPDWKQLYENSVTCYALLLPTDGIPYGIVGRLMPDEPGPLLNNAIDHIFSRVNGTPEQRFDFAEELLERKDKPAIQKVGVRLLFSLLKNNEMEAQSAFALGKLLFEPNEVLISKPRALVFLQGAADRGIPDAQLLAGQYFSRETRHTITAAEYFLLAKKNGLTLPDDDSAFMDTLSPEIMESAKNIVTRRK